MSDPDQLSAEQQDRKLQVRALQLQLVVEQAGQVVAVAEQVGEELVLGEGQVEEELVLEAEVGLGDVRVLGAGLLQLLVAGLGLPLREGLLPLLGRAGPAPQQQGGLGRVGHQQELLGLVLVHLLGLVLVHLQAHLQQVRAEERGLYSLGSNRHPCPPPIPNLIHHLPRLAHPPKDLPPTRYHCHHVPACRCGCGLPSHIFHIWWWASTIPQVEGFEEIPSNRLIKHQFMISI